MAFPRVSERWSMTSHYFTQVLSNLLNVLPCNLLLNVQKNIADSTNPEAAKAVEDRHSTNAIE